MRFPLDTAACLYRAQAFDANNTTLPNEGLRSETLLLGATASAELRDPVFASTPFGDFLHFVPGANAFASAAVPASVLNSENLWLALRYRPEPPFWTNAKLLLCLVDTPELKHLLVTETPSNRYQARFFDNTPNHAQIVLNSQVSVDPNRTDTIEVAWEGATGTARLFVNDVLQHEVVSPNPRSTVGNAHLSIAALVNSLVVTGYLLPLALWTTLRVAGLHTNTDWNATSVPPPPPPTPGVLRVFFNTLEQAQGTIVKIDGVAVLPPTVAADKIVEVLTP